MKPKMILTDKERRIMVYTLRNAISQFGSKEDFNPEDWPTEVKEQQATIRLLRKLQGTFQ